METCPYSTGKVGGGWPPEDVQGFFLGKVGCHFELCISFAKAMSDEYSHLVDFGEREDRSDNTSISWISPIQPGIHSLPQ